MKFISTAEFREDEKNLFDNINKIKDNSIRLSPYFEEFFNYFKIHPHGFFAPNIMKLLLRDIDVLAKDVPYSKIGNVILKTGNMLRTTDGVGLDPVDRNLRTAILNIWISYCTKYKGIDFSFRFTGNTRGFLLNERTLYEVLASSYINASWCMTNRKTKDFYKSIEKYCTTTSPIVKSNVLTEYGDLETISFISLLRFTNFHYEAPVTPLKLLS